MKSNIKIILASVLINIIIFVSLCFYISGNKTDSGQSLADNTTKYEGNFNNKSKFDLKSNTNSNHTKVKLFNSNINSSSLKEISHIINLLENRSERLKTKRDKFSQFLIQNSNKSHSKHIDLFDNSLIDNSDSKKYKTFLTKITKAAASKNNNVDELIGDLENDYLKICAKLIHAESLLKNKDYSSVIHTLSSDENIKDYYGYSFNETNIENITNFFKGLAYFKLGEFSDSQVSFEKIINKGPISKNDNKLLDIAIKSLNKLNS